MGMRLVDQYRLDLARAASSRRPHEQQALAKSKALLTGDTCASTRLQVAPSPSAVACARRALFSSGR